MASRNQEQEGGWRDRFRNGLDIYLNDSNIGGDDAVWIADELKQHNKLEM